MSDLAEVLRRRLEVVIGTPFTEGNSITVLRNGDQIFPAMLQAIRSAERTVDLMTFVYWKRDIAHEFADAMSGRAAAGARVRLLIDALGGRLIEKDLVDAMDRAGVQVEWFRKPLLKSPFKSNHRLHRKVCIVDGLQSAFIQNWAETGRPLYDDDFLDTLCAAPSCGLEVELLLPGPHADKRVSQLTNEGSYERLTDCGVRVCTFQPSMMHAKVMTVDGPAAMVGSSNFNRRSPDHDEEAGGQPDPSLDVTG